MSELGKRVDLKPCPFCGAVYMGRTDGFIHQTDCFLTFIASYRVGPYSGEDAEKAWNSRALLAPREEEPGLREVVGDIEHLIDMAETMSKRDLLSRLRHISTAGESALAARPVEGEKK